tara:strand:+ start:209 stop:490 length:282 start_codon:yes stop_codon:yes gene_type:complete
MSKFLLVITICSNLGCLPPMTNEKWEFTNEDDCYKKGYYAIAEIAETYMDVVGVDEFKTMQVRMLYNCVSEDKWKEQMKPVEEGKPLVFEQNA